VCVCVCVCVLKFWLNFILTQLNSFSTRRLRRCHSNLMDRLFTCYVNSANCLSSTTVRYNKVHRLFLQQASVSTTQVQRRILPTQANSSCLLKRLSSTYLICYTHLSLVVNHNIQHTANTHTAPFINHNIQNTVLRHTWYFHIYSSCCLHKQIRLYPTSYWLYSSCSWCLHT
jgi:hypothetical protein